MISAATFIPPLNADAIHPPRVAALPAVRGRDQRTSDSSRSCSPPTRTAGSGRNGDGGSAGWSDRLRAARRPGPDTAPAGGGRVPRGLRSRGGGPGARGGGPLAGSRLLRGRRVRRRAVVPREEHRGVGRGQGAAALRPRGLRHAAVRGSAVPPAAARGGGRVGGAPLVPPRVVRRVARGDAPAFAPGTAGSGTPRPGRRGPAARGTSGRPRGDPRPRGPGGLGGLGGFRGRLRFRLGARRGGLVGAGRRDGPRATSLAGPGRDPRARGRGGDPRASRTRRPRCGPSSTRRPPARSPPRCSRSGCAAAARTGRSLARINEWVLPFFVFSRPAFLAVGRAMAGVPIGATLRVVIAAALAAAITLAACEIARRPDLLRFLTGLRERSDAS